MLDKEVVINALKGVKYPGYSRDIVSFGLVKQVSAGDGAVTVAVELSGGNPQIAQQIKAASEEALRSLPEVRHVFVEVKQPVGQPATGGNAWTQQNKVPGIRRIVAVASGKGGVGKSTVSVNLAITLAVLGIRTGLVDADLAAPDIPHMLGIRPIASAVSRSFTPRSWMTGKTR